MKFVPIDEYRLTSALCSKSQLAIEYAYRLRERFQRHGSSGSTLAASNLWREILT